MTHVSAKCRKLAAVSVWMALAVASAIPATASAGITARLQHAEIPVDRSTRLMVSLTGTSSDKPELPTVPGLRFIPTGTSSQVQFVNGQMSAAVTYTFQVQASKTGDYTIPPITVEVNGETQSTEPLELRVVQAAGPGSRSTQRVQPAVPAPRTAPGAAPKGSVGREAAFLELETRKGELYTGEMVPIAIKAYFREGLGVSVTPPQLAGDAFVLHDLSDDPKKSRVRVGDAIYTVLTWESAISAIKEGRYPIEAKLDATIQIPTQRRRRSALDSRLRDDFFGGSLFNDDFFNSFFNDDFLGQFFGAVEERAVELTSKPRQMRVTPLPEEGRPADFDGAVGQFELAVEAAPTQLQVGDPITLEMTISGSGNFDRVRVPSLTEDAGWRTYEGSGAFKKSDVSGYRGRKRFEQAIVPETPRIDAVPPVRFSYFDTRRKKYVTLESEPIPVELTGTAIAPSVVRSENTGEMREDAAAALVPIHLEAGRGASLEPLILQPWFLGLQGLPLGALVLGLFLYRRHATRTANPEWVRKKEASRRLAAWRADMEAAVRKRDTAAFVRAGRRAIREQLASLWRMSADAITLAELNARLPEGYPGLRRVFETADALAYAGQSCTGEALEEWHGQVLSELDALAQQEAREER